MKKQLKNKKKIRVAQQRAAKGIVGREHGPWKVTDVQVGVVTNFESTLLELGERELDKPVFIHNTPFGRVYSINDHLRLQQEVAIDKIVATKPELRTEVSKIPFVEFVGLNTDDIIDPRD